MMIPVRSRRGVLWAKVDEEDYDRLAGYRWSLREHGGYARRSGSRLMHREVMGLRRGDGLEIDHVNGDPLDNRKANLRITDRAGNMANRARLNSNNKTGYRGVSFDVSKGKYRAKVSKRFLGCFDTAEEANEVVTAWRRKHMPTSEQDAA